MKSYFDLFPSTMRPSNDYTDSWEIDRDCRKERTMLINIDDCKGLDLKLCQLAEGENLTDEQYRYFTKGWQALWGMIIELPSADRPHIGYTGVDEDYLVSIQEVLNITAETGALETQRRVRELARRDRSQEWIPCSERLPSEYGNYLIVKEYDNVDIGTYNPDGRIKWSGCDADGFHWLSDWEVLAWMSLPQPWKGADDEYDK